MRDARIALLACLAACGGTASEIPGPPTGLEVSWTVDDCAPWDGAATKESRATTLFMAWRARMLAGLRGWLYGGGSGYTPLRVLERVIDQELAVLDSLAPAAAREAAAAAGDVPWGEAHRLRLDHPLAQMPVLGPLLGFGRDAIPREGSPGSVNVAHSVGSRPPFRMTAGPSQPGCSRSGRLTRSTPSSTAKTTNGSTTTPCL